MGRSRAVAQDAANSGTSLTLLYIVGHGMIRGQIKWELLSSQELWLQKRC